jgi:hypothetical protein
MVCYAFFGVILMNKIRRLISLFLIVIFLSPGFSQTVTPQIEPYTKDEFPQWAKDLRRTEIITFGSLPFVTLVTSLIYSLALTIAGHPEPFSYTSNYQDDRLRNVIIIAASTSVAIGLTDLTINLVKRNIAKKRLNETSGAITVMPLQQSINEEIPPYDEPGMSGDTQIEGEN